MFWNTWTSDHNIIKIARRFRSHLCTLSAKFDSVIYLKLFGSEKKFL